MRLALLLVLLTALPAHADLAQIRLRKQLLVSVKKEGAADPKQHQDPLHFQKRGFELELARAITRHILGDARALQTSEQRGTERLATLTAGQVDMVIAMVPIPPAPVEKVAYSQPYYVGAAGDPRLLPPNLPPGQPVRFGVAVRQNDAALLRAVDEVIGELKRSGELARMIARNHLPGTP